MSTGVRRSMQRLLAAAFAGVVLWGGWSGWQNRRDGRALARIQQEIDERRYARAARELDGLLTRRPGWDEALHLLGTCELELGRPEAAEEAWARVSPGSPFATRAILGRVQIRMGRGQFAEAEGLIREIGKDPRIDAASLSSVLGPVYLEQGRLEETLRLIESRWEALDRAGEGASEAALNLVREYIHLRQDPMPVETIRSALDRAASLAPGDDRVWLAKAHLAIRTGSFDEALRWLNACLERRPGDVPAWRARLDWAVATNRPAEAREAMDHVPAAETTAGQLLRWAAWLAPRLGDQAAERRVLERLVATDPADLAAWDRLIELSAQEGRTARADELRRRKAEIVRLDARYRELYLRNQPRRDAVEMSRLAEQLGHRFEARAYLTRAAAAEPGRADLRRDLERLRRPVPRPTRPDQS